MLDEVFHQILPDFNKVYPNTEVRLKVSNYGEHHDTLLKGIVDEKGLSDVVVVEFGYIPYCLGKETFVDLNKAPSMQNNGNVKYRAINGRKPLQRMDGYLHFHSIFPQDAPTGGGISLIKSV